MRQSTTASVTPSPAAPSWRCLSAAARTRRQRLSLSTLSSTLQVIRGQGGSRCTPTSAPLNGGKHQRQSRLSQRLSACSCPSSAKRVTISSAAGTTALSAGLRVTPPSKRDLEARSTFSFQPGQWLADIADGIISPAQRDAVSAGKIRAAERRQLEAALPPGLRYVKGWPQRMPTTAEADDLACVRSIIADHHGLSTPYRRGPAVRDRFAELIAAKPS